MLVDLAAEALPVGGYSSKLPAQSRPVNDFLPSTPSHDEAEMRD